MTALFVIGAIIVVLAIVAGGFWAAGRRDTRRALGTLKSETISRDRMARRAEAQAAGELVPVTAENWVAPTEAELGVSRRQFLNRGILSLVGLSVAGFGTGLVSYLWPSSVGGFGSKISLGKISDLKAEIAKSDGFFYVPEGKLFVTNYPAAAIAKAKTVYSAPELASMEAGLAVLYQKCPHLGCRVPPCNTSQWFECPCHGSQYNQAGEKKSGPAPRGMDRFATSVSGGSLTVDTGTVIQGPAIGTDTTGQEAEGPHCISGGE